MRQVVSVFGANQSNHAGYNNIGVSQAYEQWSQPGVSPTQLTFLDVRSVEEHAKVHIEGALLIPIEALAKRRHELPRNGLVYVICHSGWRSAKASAALARAGYANVANVLGGIEAWQKAGYPTASLVSNKAE